MKTLLIYLVAIVSIISAYSQDIIDPPKLPTNFNDTAIYDKNFTDTNFIRGWSWGTPGRKLDEAMFMNYFNFLTSESVVIFVKVTLNSGIRNIEQNFIHNS